MKKVIAMVLAGIMLTAFSSPNIESPAMGEVTELTGYKLRYTQVDFRDFNLWVVTNEEAFYTEFEAEHETVIRPDFSKQMVIAAKVETYNYTYNVKFKKLEADGTTLNVYFNVKKDGESRNGAGPVTLAMTGKDKGIRKVNFYHDNVLVKTVPIVAVY
jgi:hypothetical protein